MPRIKQNSNVGVVNKWGNSQGVRLPKAYCQQLGIAPGDEVRIILVDEAIVIEKKAQNATLQSRMKYWGGSTQNGRETAAEQPVQKSRRPARSVVDSGVQISAETDSWFENSLETSNLEIPLTGETANVELDAVMPEEIEVLRGSETGFETPGGPVEPLPSNPHLTEEVGTSADAEPSSGSNSKENVKKRGFFSRLFGGE